MISAKLLKHVWGMCISVTVHVPTLAFKVKDHIFTAEKFMKGGIRGRIGNTMR
jgi:hypothetical protein